MAHPAAPFSALYSAIVGMGHEHDPLPEDVSPGAVEPGVCLSCGDDFDPVESSSPDYCERDAEFRRWYLGEDGA